MAEPLLFELVPAEPGHTPGRDGDSFTVLEYEPGQSLAQAVYLSGLVRAPALCSGLALCGRCRMRIVSGGRGEGAPEPLEAEQRLLSAEELERGVRLACRHPARPGMRVELPPETVPLAPQNDLQAGNGAAETAHADGCLLAVDLGTTSMQWRLLAPSGAVVRRGGEVNPQMGAGSDVLSRLAAARSAKGGERLFRLTLAALRRAAASAFDAPGLAGEAGGRACRGLVAMCLAANPAMTAISLGLDSSGLAAYPYSLPSAGGGWESLPGLPPLWLPPQLSPFVGGDVSSGYAALALEPGKAAPPYPFLLADMGTNGEFLLALSPDRALCASVALGPALEGIGLSCGTEARPGAVADFVLGPRGLVALVLPEDSDRPAGRAPRPASEGERPPGITGTGYIALLHVLLHAGALDRQGRFIRQGGGALKRFFRFAEVRGMACLELPQGLSLPASDVEEVLKVKAAFSLGLRRLLESADLATHRLSGVYLAGALGEHVNKDALENLGFFPPGMAERLLGAGNTALAGAALLVRSETARNALVRWAGGVGCLDLASDAAFVRDYASHMRFVW